MAELSFFIVPRDPYFIPDRAAIKKAKAALRRYFPWAEGPPKVETFEEARFFYGYDACDRYTCPACTRTVNASDVEARAGDGGWLRMLEAARLGQDALAYAFEAPCCNTRIRLQDMTFSTARSQLTAGIGRFRLRMTDIDDVLSDERVARLGKMLGGDVELVVAISA